MKYAILLAILTATTLMSNSISSASNEITTITVGSSVDGDYCDGWEDGFRAGWKKVRGNFAAGVRTPSCPTPSSDCRSGYNCGYNRGYKLGMKMGRETP